MPLLAPILVSLALSVIAVQPVTDAASTVAGRDVKVVCDVSYQADDWAFADMQWGIAYIHPDFCRSLDALAARIVPAAGPRARTAATAALVLTHEIGHIVLGADEHAAECFAVAHAPALVAALDPGLNLTGLIRAQDKRMVTPCR